MAWVLPTGFEDPGGEWENGALTLDGSTDTWAEREGLSPDTWSSFLLFTFPPSIVKHVAWHAGVMDGEGLLDLDVYIGRTWTDIREQAIARERVGWEYYVGDVATTAFRIRLKHFSDQPTTVRIYLLKINTTCGGPFVDICGFLGQVGAFFIDLSLDISELWLIGQFLATPFEILGELFYTGTELCCTASLGLQTVLDIVAEGTTVDAIRALILENWPTLYYLITDPVDWFLVQLTLAFDLEPWHTQSLEFLAKYILQEYFPILWELVLFPEDWFATLFEDRFPLLYYLAVDPEGEIRYLIGQWFDFEPFQVGSWALIVKALMERFFPILWELYLDPEAWLIEHVDPRVLAVPVAIAAFLDDPWGWLFDVLEDQIETYVDRIGEIALKIIARLLGV